MNPREVLELWTTVPLYTQRPHRFHALSPKSPTCMDCGHIRAHSIHKVPSRAKERDQRNQG